MRSFCHRKHGRLSHAYSGLCLTSLRAVDMLKIILTPPFNTPISDPWREGEVWENLTALYDRTARAVGNRLCRLIKSVPK